MEFLLIQFALLALALWRLTHLMVLERGPFAIFLRMRTALGAYDYDEHGELKSELGQLLSCPYCVGMYLAVPAAAVLFFVPFRLEGIGWLWLVVGWLALAGLQAVIEQWLTRA